MQAIPVARGPSHLGGKQGLSEAKRNAEALFESRTVAEIREIENRTRKDIELKKQQLRQLVGDSYRDLIESADKIVSIANNCGLILNNVKAIQGGFTSLAHSFTTADSLLNEKRDSFTKHEELYAVGGRIRYLVDTPEVIWGCLDSQQFLGATRRYLRAHQVYTLLQTSFSQDMLGRFPLLTHQWPVVEKFKKQISDAVSGALASEAALHTDAAADALAAACALDALDSQSALALLLSSRRTWIQAQLAAHHETGGSVGSVAEVGQTLARLANAVQATVQQVGELFLAGGRPSAASPAYGGLGAGDAGVCALRATAREDEVDVSELMFGGVGQAGIGTAAQGPEVDAWRKANRAMQERLVALSSGVAERTCLSWIREVAGDFASLGPALLRACATAQDLVQVEAAVCAAIALGPAHSGNSTATGRHAKGAGSNVGAGGATAIAHAASAALPASLHARRQLSAPSGLSAGAMGLGSAGAAGSSMVAGGTAAARGGPTWDSVCEWVLGAPLLLWQECFHVPFVARAKELVAGAFEAVAAAVEQPLGECLAAAAESAPEAAGEVASTRWPLAPLPASTNMGGEGEGTRGVAHAWSGKLAAGNTARGNKTGVPGVIGAAAVDKKFRLRVAAIRQQLDDELASVLQSVLLLLKSDVPHAAAVHAQYSASVPGGLNDMGGAGGASAGGAVAAAGGRGGRREGSRAVELEPFVQQQCSELCASLAAMLRGRLEAVGAPAAGLPGVAAAEQVLLLGRLSSALAGESRFLQVLLGPPDAWRSAGSQAPGAIGRAAALRSAAAARAAPQSSRLQAVVDGFRATGIAAYKLWAVWAAGCLVGPLRTSLLADETLTSNATPPSWQVTVIAPTGGSGGFGGGLGESGLMGGDVGGEMRFHLPACPSPAVQAFLAAACAELRRAGDHTVAVEALQIFEWELGGAALECYSALLGPKQQLGGLGEYSSGLPGAITPSTPTTPRPTSLAGRLSEKGTLQLLMDVRFVRDVLAGGRPLNPRTASVAVAAAGASGSAAPPLLDPQDPVALAAVAERRRTGLGLEQQLQDRLDPIDWATYEPYLWANAKRYYARTATLYGMLVQLHRMHTDGAAAGGRAAGAGTAGAATTPTGVVDLNPINVLPVAPRFQYLPISAPTGAALGASRNRPSTQSFPRLASGNISGSDLAGAYSFAELGTGLRGSNVGVETSGAAAAAAAAAAGASSALGALQARLQATGALGSLGSMLGDKAAEMTAMAQQRFDSISDLLPGALTGGGMNLGSASGLLSSLTKGVGGGVKK